MKKLGLFIICSFLSAFCFAEKIYEPVVLGDDDEINRANITASIRTVGEPYIIGDYVIFTQKDNVRHIGIALDFEDYRTIHSFTKKNNYNVDGEVEGSLLFYILKLNKNVQDFKYRLVVDALWTVDPMNKQIVYDYETDLNLSYFNAERDIPKATEYIRTENQGNCVRFIYKGESGQKIRLGGNWTNWDSWIYELEEIEPGIYQTELELGKGTYEYAYYAGINTFPDNTNPKKVYFQNGKVGSVITVE